MNFLSKNKKNIVSKSIILAGLMLLFILGGKQASAQTAACDGNISGKSDAELNVILAECEKEIAAQQTVLDGQKTKSRSLQNDITTLQANIDAAKKRINQKNVVIKTLGNDIKSKAQTIEELNDHIEKGKESLAQLIRKTNEIDNTSFANALLTSTSISDFYSDVDTYSSVKRSVQASVEAIKSDKAETEGVKQQLEVKQSEQIDAKAEIEHQKSLVEKNQSDQKVLLNISKNKEAEYQQVLAERKAKAAAIRSALFKLRGQGAIPFGDAYDYAKVASAKTGVRPAFILAILKQESNMGANVGSCIITDLSSGQTKSVNSGTVFSNGIHPTRDLPTLQTILKDLGRDPLQTLVSCPIFGVPGYGGGMGPAQFIPSTWKGLASRIGAAVGKSTPDPWDPADAIMANAIYVSDLGAGAGTYTAERTAALKYYAGGNWNSPGNAFYGNAVMENVKAIQANIDVLESI
jgi:peptidoglycan hydrolase CwlO-like protein